MRLLEQLISFISIIIICFSLGVSLGSGACDPEPVIVNQLPRMGTGWSGSVAWYNGKIYEVADATSYALIKNPVTGATEGQINFGSWAADDTKGFTYDPFRGTFWCKVGMYIYEVAVTGGNALSQILIQTEGFVFGIWCDPDEENVMWLADPVYAQVRKVNIVTGQTLRYVNTDFNVRGVARAGNTLWCTYAGEPGDNGVVIQIDMNGNELCKYFLPVTPYDHDVGGCDIDPDGYLWMEGGKLSAIYQLDIGYSPAPPTPVPPTPTPVPTPTPDPPAAPVVDSGDYNGDGTSDIAIFRGSSGLWAVRNITRVYYGTNDDIPAPGDYDGDGTTDMGIYRDSVGLWSVRGITHTYYGAREDLPVPGDYDGDGLCDIAIFRPSRALWAVKSITRTYYGSSDDIPVPIYGARPAKYIGIFRPATGLWAIRDLTRTFFGSSIDQPVPADYGGTKIGSDLGIFRDSTGLWAVLGVTRVYFGGAGDQPVPGAYRGGEIADAGIYRSSLGMWAIRGLTRVFYGRSDDIPVSGRAAETSIGRPLIDSSDYNGDGTDDIAVFRPATGLWAIRGISQMYYGDANDIPTPGDYSGDGTTLLSTYQNLGRRWAVRNLTRVNFVSEIKGQPVPADYTGDRICDMGFFNNGLWTVRIQFPFPFTVSIHYGQAGDQPVPGDYDGENAESLAIFRPSSGLWAVKDFTRFYFGLDGDIGMPGDYNGDGRTDPAVFRPSQGEWLVKDMTTVNFRRYDNVIPVSADFNGDGTDGMGLFRPLDGLWQLYDFSRFYFGGDQDLPVSGSFDR